jgi:hypothetical protein
MPNIRSTDMLFLDDLFEMGGGYVLNFSDRTIARFFAEELNIDFDDPIYAANGTSKAKRLRCFLQTVDRNTVVRTLSVLWEYREAMRLRAGVDEKIQNAHGRFLALLDKISGGNSQPTGGHAPAPAFDRAAFAELLREFQQLAQLQPQPRGYAFEGFLTRLFNKFGLEAREPFRLRGEQIDGSFVLANETYLIEGKWQNAPSAIDAHISWEGRAEGGMGSGPDDKLERVFGRRIDCLRTRQARHLHGWPRYARDVEPRVAPYPRFGEESPPCGRDGPCVR